MTLDAELLEILVCPNDRGDVDYHEDEQVIVCRTCGYRYPVRDGIPVMLIDEAEKPGGRSRARSPKRAGQAESQEVTIDLDDARAVRDQDPGACWRRWPRSARIVREGYSNGAAARGLPDLADMRGVVVCGMGGSAVAGDVLRSVFRDRLGVPVEVNRSPELPEHAGPHSLVIASSYSGNTSETLAAFREATKRGCRAIVVSSGGTIVDEAGEAGVPVVRVPGGFQPRAALGWLAFTALGALEAAGLLPPLAEDVDEAAGEADARAAACGPDAPAERQSGEAARRGDRGPGPGDLGCRGHRGRRRGPLEDAVQRERQGAGMVVIDVRARSQRGRRMDRAVRPRAQR